MSQPKADEATMSPELAQIAGLVEDARREKWKDVRRCAKTYRTPTTNNR